MCNVQAMKCRLMKRKCKQLNFYGLVLNVSGPINTLNNAIYRCPQIELFSSDQYLMYTGYRAYTTL